MLDVIQGSLKEKQLT